MANGVEVVGELPRSFHTKKPRMIGAATTFPAIEVHVPAHAAAGTMFSKSRSARCRSSSPQRYFSARADVIACGCALVASE